MTDKHWVLTGHLFPAGNCGFRRAGSAPTESGMVAEMPGQPGNRMGSISFSDAGRTIAENRNYLTDRPVQNAVHQSDGMYVLNSGIGDLSAVQSPGVQIAGSAAACRGRALTDINAEIGLARLQKKKRYWQQQTNERIYGLGPVRDRMTTGCADNGRRPCGSATAEAGKLMQKVVNAND